MIIFLMLLFSANAKAAEFHLPDVFSRVESWGYETTDNVNFGVADKYAVLKIVFESVYDESGEHKLIYRHAMPGLIWDGEFKNVFFGNTRCAKRRWFGIKKLGCKFSYRITTDGFIGEFTE